MPSFSGIVIAEAIHDTIPEWVEHLNQQILPERNPNIVDRKIPAEKIAEVQIGGRADGFAVLRQPIVENGARRSFETEAAFASTLRNRLTDIDRYIPPIVGAVSFGEMAVGLKIADVIDGVNAGGDEPLAKRKTHALTRQQRIRDAGA